MAKHAQAQALSSLWAFAWEVDISDDLRVMLAPHSFKSTGDKQNSTWELCHNGLTRSKNTCGSNKLTGREDASHVQCMEIGFWYMCP